MVSLKNKLLISEFILSICRLINKSLKRECVKKIFRNNNQHKNTFLRFNYEKSQIPHLGN